jgi:co-chaperonin GroES (HSP10)
LVEVLTDDFIRESKNANKFKVDKKGKVTLAGGWFPTESNLKGTIKTGRPALRKFRLVVSVRSCAFTSSGLVCKPIFDSTYIRRESQKPKTSNGSKLSGTKDKPIDVEDFIATSSSKSKGADEPEHTVVFDQSVVQELYDAFEAHEDDSEMGGDGSDSYDDFDEEMAMMQEGDDMAAGYEGFEEDDEDDVLFGMGGRPRWAAY